MHTVRLTTLRSSRGCSAQPFGVRLLRWPTVGKAMVMYGTLEGRRIVTSPIVRLFEDADSDATYVETRNSLYRLESCEDTEVTADLDLRQAAAH